MSAQSAPPTGESSLVLRDPNARTEIDDPRLKKLWIALQRRRWRSLAVVAGSEGVSTIELANTFARVAWRYRGEPSCVVDCRDLSLRLVEYQLREVAAQAQHGQCVIIALRSIFENPTTISVASVADAAVLCVRLGESKIAHAAQTIEEIGRERFIGSVVLREPGSQRPRGHVKEPGR